MRHEQKNFNIIVNKKTIPLLVIIVFSFFIHWKDIDRIPYGIEHDELSWTVTSLFHQYGIVASEKGVWSLHDTAAQRFPVSIKINQLSFVVFGKDFLSPKKMLIVVNIISLFFFYLVSRRFMSKKSSLTITLLYSLSTYNLIANRVVVAPIFSQLFIFPAILLLSILSIKSTLRNYVFVFLAGVAISLNLLTHNLSYTLPLVGIALLYFFAYKHISSCGIWFSLKHFLALLIIFLIPIAFSSQIWLPGIREEVLSKSYALGNTAFGIKQNKFYFSIDKMINNASVVKKQLFDSLEYETSDFIVRYPGPLVNKIVSIGFLLGLIVSVLKIKRYLPLLIWLFLVSLTYHLFLGLFLPRMWTLTIGLLYLFAGITIDIILKYLSKLKVPKVLGLILIIGLSTYIIIYDLRLYYQSAVNNSSFFSSHREILEITKQHKKSLGERTLFIASEKQSTLTNFNVVHAAVAFTYLTTDPQKPEILKQMERKQLGILTDNEFDIDAQRYIAKGNSMIVDNTILNRIKYSLNTNRCLYYTGIYRYEYFTYLNFFCSNSSNK